MGVNLAAASHRAGDILRGTVLAFSDSVPQGFIGTVLFAARLTLLTPPLLFNGGTLRSPGAVVRDNIVRALAVLGGGEFERGLDVTYHGRRRGLHYVFWDGTADGSAAHPRPLLGEELCVAGGDGGPAVNNRRWRRPNLSEAMGLFAGGTIATLAAAPPLETLGLPQNGIFAGLEIPLAGSVGGDAGAMNSVSVVADYHFAFEREGRYWDGAFYLAESPGAFRHADAAFPSRVGPDAAFNLCVVEAERGYEKPPDPLGIRVTGGGGAWDAPLSGGPLTVTLAGDNRRAVFEAWRWTESGEQVAPADLNVVFAGGDGAYTPVYESPGSGPLTVTLRRVNFIGDLPGLVTMAASPPLGATVTAVLHSPAPAVYLDEYPPVIIAAPDYAGLIYHLTAADPALATLSGALRGESGVFELRDGFLRATTALQPGVHAATIAVDAETKDGAFEPRDRRSFNLTVTVSVFARPPQMTMRAGPNQSGSVRLELRSYPWPIEFEQSARGDVVNRPDLDGARLDILSPEGVATLNTPIGAYKHVSQDGVFARKSAMTVAIGATGVFLGAAQFSVAVEFPDFVRFGTSEDPDSNAPHAFIQDLDDRAFVRASRVEFDPLEVSYAEKERSARFAYLGRRRGLHVLRRINDDSSDHLRSFAADACRAGGWADADHAPLPHRTDPRQTVGYWRLPSLAEMAGIAREFSGATRIFFTNGEVSVPGFEEGMRIPLVRRGDDEVFDESFSLLALRGDFFSARRHVAADGGAGAVIGRGYERREPLGFVDQAGGRLTFLPGAEVHELCVVEARENYQRPPDLVALRYIPDSGGVSLTSSAASPLRLTATMLIGAPRISLRAQAWRFKTRFNRGVAGVFDPSLPEPEEIVRHSLHSADNVILTEPADSSARPGDVTLQIDWPGAEGGRTALATLMSAPEFGATATLILELPAFEGAITRTESGPTAYVAPDYDENGEARPSAHNGYYYRWRARSPLVQFSLPGDFPIAGGRANVSALPPPPARAGFGYQDNAENNPASPLRLAAFTVTAESPRYDSPRELAVTLHIKTLPPQPVVTLDFPPARRILHTLTVLGYVSEIPAVWEKSGAAGGDGGVSISSDGRVLLDTQPAAGEYMISAAAESPGASPYAPPEGARPGFIGRVSVGILLRVSAKPAGLFFNEKALFAPDDSVVANGVEDVSRETAGVGTTLDVETAYWGERRGLHVVYAKTALRARGYHFAGDKLCEAGGFAFWRARDGAGDSGNRREWRRPTLPEVLGILRDGDSAILRADGAPEHAVNEPALLIPGLRDELTVSLAADSGLHRHHRGPFTAAGRADSGIYARNRDVGSPESAGAFSRVFLGGEEFPALSGLLDLTQSGGDPDAATFCVVEADEGYSRPPQVAGARVRFHGAGGLPVECELSRPNILAGCEEPIAVEVTLNTPFSTVNRALRDLHGVAASLYRYNESGATLAGAASASMPLSELFTLYRGEGRVAPQFVSGWVVEEGFSAEATVFFRPEAGEAASVRFVFAAVAVNSPHPDPAPTPTGFGATVFAAPLYDGALHRFGWEDNGSGADSFGWQIESGGDGPWTLSYAADNSALTASARGLTPASENTLRVRSAAYVAGKKTRFAGGILLVSVLAEQPILTAVVAEGRTGALATAEVAGFADIVAVKTGGAENLTVHGAEIAFVNSEAAKAGQALKIQMDAHSPGGAFLGTVRLTAEVKVGRGLQDFAAFSPPVADWTAHAAAGGLRDVALLEWTLPTDGRTVTHEILQDGGRFETTTFAGTLQLRAVKNPPRLNEGEVAAARIRFENRMDGYFPLTVTVSIAVTALAAIPRLTVTALPERRHTIDTPLVIPLEGEVGGYLFRLEGGAESGLAVSQAGRTASAYVAVTANLRKGDSRTITVSADAPRLFGRASLTVEATVRLRAISPDLVPRGDRMFYTAAGGWPRDSEGVKSYSESFGGTGLPFSAFPPDFYDEVFLPEGGERWRVVLDASRGISLAATVLAGADGSVSIYRKIPAGGGDGGDYYLGNTPQAGWFRAGAMLTATIRFVASGPDHAEMSGMMEARMSVLPAMEETLFTVHTGVLGDGEAGGDLPNEILITTAPDIPLERELGICNPCFNQIVEEIAPLRSDAGSRYAIFRGDSLYLARRLLHGEVMTLGVTRGGQRDTPNYLRGFYRYTIVVEARRLSRGLSPPGGKIHIAPDSVRPGILLRAIEGRYEAAAPAGQSGAAPRADAAPRGRRDSRRRVGEEEEEVVNTGTTDDSENEVPPRPPLVRLINNLGGRIALMKPENREVPPEPVDEPEGDDSFGDRDIISAVGGWEPGFSATVTVEVVYAEENRIPVTGTAHYTLTVLERLPPLTVTAHSGESPQNLDYFPLPDAPLDEICSAEDPCHMRGNPPLNLDTGEAARDFYLHPGAANPVSEDPTSEVFWPVERRLRLRLHNSLRAGETRRLRVDIYNPAEESGSSSGGEIVSPLVGGLIQDVYVTVAQSRPLARFNGQDIWRVFDRQLGRDSGADEAENRRRVWSENLRLSAAAVGRNVPKEALKAGVNPGQTGLKNITVAYLGVRRGLHVVYATRGDLGADYNGYYRTLCDEGRRRGDGWRMATAREAMGLLHDGEFATVKLRPAYQADMPGAAPGLLAGVALTLALPPRLSGESTEALPQGSGSSRESYAIAMSGGHSHLGALAGGAEGAGNLADDREIKQGALCVVEAESDYALEWRKRISGVEILRDAPDFARLGLVETDLGRLYQVYVGRDEVSGHAIRGTIYRGLAASWVVRAGQPAYPRTGTVSARMLGDHPDLLFKSAASPADQVTSEQTSFELAVAPGRVFRGARRVTLEFVPPLGATVSLEVLFAPGALAWWRERRGDPETAWRPLALADDQVRALGARSDADGAARDFNPIYVGIRRGLHVTRFAGAPGQGRDVCEIGSNARTQWRVPSLGEFMGILTDEERTPLSMAGLIRISQTIAGVFEGMGVFPPPGKIYDDPPFDLDSSAVDGYGYADLHGSNAGNGEQVQLIYYDSYFAGNAHLLVPQFHGGNRRASWHFCVAEDAGYSRQPHLSGVRAEWGGRRADNIGYPPARFAASATSYVNSPDPALTVTVSALRYESVAAGAGRDVVKVVQPLETLSISLLPDDQDFAPRALAAPGAEGVATVIILPRARPQRTGRQTYTLRVSPPLGREMEIPITIAVGGARATLADGVFAPGRVFAAPGLEDYLFKLENRLGADADSASYEILNAGGAGLRVSVSAEDNSGYAYARPPLRAGWSATLTIVSALRKADRETRVKTVAVTLHVLDEVPTLRFSPVNYLTPIVSATIAAPVFDIFNHPFTVLDANPPGFALTVISGDGFAAVSLSAGEQTLAVGTWRVLARAVSPFLRGEIKITAEIESLALRARFGGAPFYRAGQVAELEAGGKTREAVYLGRRGGADYVALGHDTRDESLMAEFCRAGRREDSGQWRPPSLWEFAGLFDSEGGATGALPAGAEHLSVPGVQPGYRIIRTLARPGDDPAPTGIDAGFPDVFATNGEEVFAGLFSTDGFSLLNSRPMRIAEGASASGYQGGRIICVLSDGARRHLSGVIFRRIENEETGVAQRRMDVKFTRRAGAETIKILMSPGRFGMSSDLSGPVFHSNPPGAKRNATIVSIPPEAAGVLAWRNPSQDLVEIYAAADVPESLRAVTVRMSAVHGDDYGWVHPTSELEVRIEFGADAVYNNQEIPGKGGEVDAYLPAAGANEELRLRYGGVYRGLHYLYGWRESAGTYAAAAAGVAEDICNPPENKARWRLPLPGELTGLYSESEDAAHLRHILGFSRTMFMPGAPIGFNLNVIADVPLLFAPRRDGAPLNTPPGGFEGGFVDAFPDGENLVSPLSPLVLNPRLGRLIYSRSGNAIPVCVAPAFADYESPPGIAGARVRDIHTGEIIGESGGAFAPNVTVHFAEYGPGGAFLEFFAYRTHSDGGRRAYPEAAVLNAEWVGRLNRASFVRDSAPGDSALRLKLDMPEDVPRHSGLLRAHVDGNYSPIFNLDFVKSTLSFARRHMRGPGAEATARQVESIGSARNPRNLNFKYLGQARGLHWMASARNYPSGFQESGCVKAASPSFPWRAPTLPELASGLGITRLGDNTVRPLPGWAAGMETGSPFNTRADVFDLLEARFGNVRTNLHSFDGLSAAIPPRPGEAGTTDTGAGLICVLPVDPENYERPSDLAAVRMKADEFISRSLVYVNPNDAPDGFLMTVEAEAWRYDYRGAAVVATDGAPSIRLVGPDPLAHRFEYALAGGEIASATVTMLASPAASAPGRRSLTLRWLGGAFSGAAMTMRVEGAPPFGAATTLTVVFDTRPFTPEEDVFLEPRPKRTVTEGYRGTLYAARVGAAGARGVLLRGVANAPPPPFAADGLSVFISAESGADLGRRGTRKFVALTVRAEKPGHLPILVAHTLEVSVWGLRVVHAYAAANAPGALAADLREALMDFPGGTFRKVSGEGYAALADGKIRAEQALPAGDTRTVLVEYAGGEGLLGRATLTVRIMTRVAKAFFDGRPFFIERGRIRATLTAGEKRETDLIYHGVRRGISLVYTGRAFSDGDSAVLCDAGAGEGWRPPSLGEWMALFYDGVSQVARVEVKRDGGTSAIAGLDEMERIWLPQPTGGAPPDFRGNGAYSDLYILGEGGPRPMIVRPNLRGGYFGVEEPDGAGFGRLACVRGPARGSPTGAEISHGEDYSALVGDFKHNGGAERAFAATVHVTVLFDDDTRDFNLSLRGWRRVVRGGQARTVFSDEEFDIRFSGGGRFFQTASRDNGRVIYAAPRFLRRGVAPRGAGALATAQITPQSGSPFKIVLDMKTPRVEFAGTRLYSPGQRFTPEAEVDNSYYTNLRMTYLGRRRGAHYIMSERDDFDGEVNAENRGLNIKREYGHADFCAAGAGWRTPSIGELAGLMTDADTLTVAAYVDAPEGFIGGVFGQSVRGRGFRRALPPGAGFSIPPAGGETPDFAATPDLRAYADYYDYDRFNDARPVLMSLAANGGGADFRLPSFAFGGDILGARIVCMLPDAGYAHAPQVPSVADYRDGSGAGGLLTQDRQTKTVSLSLSAPAPEGALLTMFVHAARTIPDGATNNKEDRPSHRLESRLLNGGSDFSMSVIQSPDAPGVLELRLFLDNPNYQGVTILRVETRAEFGIAVTLRAPVSRLPEDGTGGGTGMAPPRGSPPFAPGENYRRPTLAPTPSGAGRADWAASSLRMFSARRPLAAVTLPLFMSTCSSMCSAVAATAHSPPSARRCSVWKRCRRFSSPSTARVSTWISSPAKASDRWRRWVSAV